MFTIDQETVDQLQTEETQFKRRTAYAAEADPLFFKSQRGDATQQEWLDKITEIKTRYPKG